MPGGDRTGPEGRGPRTGRWVGYCSGSGMPGFTNRFVPRLGLGWRWGRGRGRGWRLPFAPREQEVDDLKGEAEWLRRRLEDVGMRIKELE